MFEGKYVFGNINPTKGSRAAVQGSAMSKQYETNVADVYMVSKNEPKFANVMETQR